MNKITVAILDTGIDLKHSFFKNIDIEGYGYYYENGQVIKVVDCQDENGHGTECASLILNQCKNIKIKVIKILDSNGKTNLKILEAALIDLIETDVSIINLSLSVINKGKMDDLYSICEMLINKGKIIVASANNRYTESYPAVFSSVIGVQGSILTEQDEFWFNKNYKIQCVIDNNPTMVCGLKNTYKLCVKSNSHSAAKFTGMICNIMKKANINIDNLLEKLEKRASKNIWSDNMISKSLRFPTQINEMETDRELIFKVFNIAKQNMDFSKEKGKIFQYRLLYIDKRLDGNNCYRFLRKLEKEFNIHLDYMQISRYDLLTIGTIANLIRKYIEFVN